MSLVSRWTALNSLSVELSRLTRPHLLPIIKPNFDSFCRYRDIRRFPIRSKYFLCILMVLVMPILISPCQVKAQSPDEARLVTIQQEIDAENPPVTYNSRVEDLARQFQLEPVRVNDLRNSGQGWGEITIELSMAEHLTRLDPRNFPAIGDAVDRISALRADGEGWGRIAQDLGFKLGPVISAVKSGRHLTPGEGNSVLSHKTQENSFIRTHGETHKRAVRTKQARAKRPSKPARLTRMAHRARPIMRPHRPARLGK